MSDLAKKALELSGKATPGPWDMAPTEHSWTVMSVGLRNPIRSQCYFDARDNAPRSAVVMDATDAAFIAFSREALPALAEEVMRLREALTELVAMYTHAWDRVDGGLSMFPDSVARFDRACEAAYSALGQPLMALDEDAALASKPEKE